VEIPPALIARANDFWGDGYPVLAEVVVLAHATDTLGDPQIESFLERLREPVVFAERPALESESDDEREAIWARLDRLASDRRLRTRYVALLRAIWAVRADVWRDHGLAEATATAAAWAARLEAGADILELLPEQHIARREPYSRMARRAQRQGVLRLSPCTVGHGHIVALPGMISISVDARAEDSTLTRRRDAAETAERLRVLSDPTRLTILAHLARAPVGVSDLARALHIAQPTASVHLRQLREAGLVSAQRSGTRNVYSAHPAAVEDLLAEVTERLTRSMAP
jgi:DNA-binding transcriptional ArsR family regulator